MLIRVLSGEKGIRQNNVVGTEVLYKDPADRHGSRRKRAIVEVEGLKITTMESLILAQDER